MLKTYNTRDEWLAARRLSIGSSDSGVLWGPDCCYASQSPYQLWCDKALGVAWEPTKTELRRLRIGAAAEPIIREWAADELGQTLSIDPPNTIRVSEEFPFMSASLDSFYEGFDGLVVVELKHVGQHNKHEWDDDNCPLIYACQAAHQALVVGASRAIVCGACGDELFVRYIELDRDWAASHVAKCRDFWALVERKEAPPVDASPATTDAIKARWRRERGPRVEVNSWLDDLAAALAANQEAYKELGAAIDGQKNKIMDAIGDAEGCISPSGVEFSWKWQERKEYVVAASSSRVLRRVGARKGK